VNTPLTSTSGPNNTPGSTRTFNVKTTEGTYTLTEEVSITQTRPALWIYPIPNHRILQLINFETTSDGSFVQQLAQLNIPVPYSSGNGSLSGLWATLEANYASQYETALEWIVHACFTGHPINFALFKTAGINNALAILKSRGLLKGETLGPYAVQSF
jgi:hypothetical protein